MTATKLFACILTALQLLFLNVSYGSWGTPAGPGTPPSPPGNDIRGDSALSPSVLYAAEMQNLPQGFYNSAEREQYTVRNADISLTHELAASKLATLCAPSGGVYLEDTFDVFYTAGGKTWYAAQSAKQGRVNAIRLGTYYLEAHVRDLNFPAASGGAFWADKAYHVYGDRLYQELILYAAAPSTALQSFGLEAKIPAGRVASMEQTEGYAAFDIKDVGVVGFIIPSDGSSGTVTVTEESGNYIFRQMANYAPGTAIRGNDESGDGLYNVRFGNRIYTDTTHDFAGIAAAAEEERSPLTEIAVEGGNANARFIGYEALRGCYLFQMDGTGFNEAWAQPDMRFEAPLRFTGADGRDICVRMNGASGGLEAAAILDENGQLAPIPVQVCKNFQGDGGEPFYSVKDWMYGDSFFPLRLAKDEPLRLTLLNLYQNWGRHPLKQLSSIEFFISYYHLSTGVTESNCIAPYFVFGRDGWILPDFRGCSGTMWAEQPQFNSVGRLYGPAYQRSPRKKLLSEYLATRIDSAGLSYADVTTFYRSDCGSYDYSLRHVEFPQADENRTYYTLDLTFNRDMTFKNARRDFLLFSFDGRDVRFGKAGWLDENNQPQVKSLSLPLLPILARPEYISLGDDCPYFGYFDMRRPDNVDIHMGMNLALIVKDSEITLGGAPYEGGFAFKNSADGRTNTGALVLDAKCLQFKAGDRVRVDFILLPWGTGLEPTDANVLAVREDSALHPLAIESGPGSLMMAAGRVIPDAYLPIIECEDGRGGFLLSGGGGRSAVRVNGFTQSECPKIERSVEFLWEPVELASDAHGDDGYTVFYNPETGLYDFAFVLETDGGAREYRVGDWR
ncbi:MAG: hypothetical protein FWE98_00345 [Oscillospiraceae bacterium]|nr:hypothetical protein [Oscillospiraceae bacterium]